jgi:hypothetical protein
MMWRSQEGLPVKAESRVHSRYNLSATTLFSSEQRRGNSTQNAGLLLVSRFACGIRDSSHRMYQKEVSCFTFERFAVEHETHCLARDMVQWRTVVNELVNISLKVSDASVLLM